MSPPCPSSFRLFAGSETRQNERMWERQPWNGGQGPWAVCDCVDVCKCICVLFTSGCDVCVCVCLHGKITSGLPVLSCWCVYTQRSSTYIFLCILMSVCLRWTQQQGGKQLLKLDSTLSPPVFNSTIPHALSYERTHTHIHTHTHTHTHTSMFTSAFSTLSPSFPEDQLCLPPREAVRAACCHSSRSNMIGADVMQQHDVSVMVKTQKLKLLQPLFLVMPTEGRLLRHPYVLVI